MIYIKPFNISSAVISDLDRKVSMSVSVLYTHSLFKLDPSNHFSSHSASSRTCLMFCLRLISNSAQSSGCFFISVFCLLQVSLRVRRRPAGPQVHVANTWRHSSNPLHRLQSALWEPEQEKGGEKKQSWWGLGSRLAARLKHGTENGSCQEMWRWGRAGEVHPSPSPLTLGSVWRLCHMR